MSECCLCFGGGLGLLSKYVLAGLGVTFQHLLDAFCAAYRCPRTGKRVAALPIHRMPSAGTLQYDGSLPPTPSVSLSASASAAAGANKRRRVPTATPTPSLPAAGLFVVLPAAVAAKVSAAFSDRSA